LLVRVFFGPKGLPPTAQANGLGNRNPKKCGLKCPQPCGLG
jgi:hypothetical protein